MWGNFKLALMFFLQTRHVCFGEAAATFRELLCVYQSVLAAPSFQETVDFYLALCGVYIYCVYKKKTYIFFYRPIQNNYFSFIYSELEFRILSFL